MPLVELNGVDKSFQTSGGNLVHALRSVSLSINPGETLGLIGESGSGKSTIGKLVLGLHRPDAGQVRFDGQDLALLNKHQLRAQRQRMQAVFQQPFDSMNPVFTIGENVAEPLVNYRRDLSRPQRQAKVLESLDHVGLPAAYAERYPAELSGGELQRAAIARAIINRPDLIVLDEPTSSLDLSVRAAVLLLLSSLQRELKLTYLFISHDITTVAFLSSRIDVLYNGVLVESGSRAQILSAPAHPYTRTLLSAFLSSDPDVRPAPLNLRDDPVPADHPGCVFYGRCPIGSPDCSLGPIDLIQFDTGRSVRCLKS